MGCCSSRDNSNKEQYRYHTSKPEDSGYEMRGHQFRASFDSDAPETSELNRSNYNKPNLSPISINDEQSLCEGPLKLMKEDMLEIILNIVSFDFLCSPGFFFNNFYSDFNPELLLTFEDKIENFIHEKNIEVEVDEDYLNRSGQFEMGLLGMSKRKCNSTSYISNFNSNSNGNTSPSPKNKILIGEKKVKQFLFDNNLFKIPEIPLTKINNLDKNNFINLALFQKNRRDDSNRYIIGEGFLPVHFLYSAFQDDLIEIPIYNHIEDIFLGNLILKIETRFIKGDPNSDSNSENFGLTKNQNLVLINDFLKFQVLNLHDYGKVLRKSFNQENEIPSLFDYNLFKIQLHSIIGKFIKSNGDKCEDLKELYEFFYEYVDTAVNNSNGENNTDTEFITRKNSYTSLSQPNYSTLQDNKRFRLDFKTLNQTKYFILILMLNEILTKCDNSDQNFTLLKNSKFLNEKIIFSPYETSKNENKNYLLAQSAISLLLNIRKNTSTPFDPRYRIDYLLAYYGLYYKKSLGHYLTLLEKTGMKFSNYYKENSLNSFGPVSNESFVIFRSLVYNFLKLVKMSLDNKNENLDPIFQKEMTANKYEELVEISSQDIEAIKRNHFYFLCTKETVFKKDRQTVEKELLYIKDINYVIGVLNIFNSYFKLAKNLAKNHLKILPVEFYISHCLSDNSDFLNFVSTTLKIFWKNPKYLNLLLDIMYELFSDAYGIFIHNFFKKVDINLLFKAFSIDAKYIDSRKFNTWNSFFIIISKCCKLIKKPDGNSLDFLNLKWESIYNQILSLNTILQKNHYFKVADEIDLEFESISNQIVLKNTKCKFMTNKICIKIQNKFFEIFYDFTFKTELINSTIKTNEKTLNKFFSRIVFLTLIKIDGGLVEIVKQNAEYFFKTYMNILNILINLKTNLNFDIQNEITTGLSSIFSTNSSSVLGVFDYNKFVGALGGKIKSMAPNKFDFKNVQKILEKLKK